MPPHLDFETKCLIIHLRPVLKSVPKIVERLKELGKIVGKSTVYSVFEEMEKKSNGWVKPPRKLPEHMRPSVRKKSAITKVKRLIKNKNPPSISAIADKTAMSRRSAARILKEDVDASQLKKRPVHALTAKQADQRYVRGKKFRKFLSRRKLKMLFTMDETIVSANDIRGETDFYYKQHG